jgi:hypothetical protein
LLWHQAASRRQNVTQHREFSNFHQSRFGGRAIALHPAFATGGIMIIASAFIDALHADAPAPDRDAKMGLYGWLIGSWTMDAVVHLGDGKRHEGSGEIHFGWVLQGRAVQDVWILPDVFYGTTLRIYDPGLDAWHILWSDPLRQFYTRQIGRACGRDIVQEGTNDAGDGVRWSFTEITPHSFRWLGERSRDGGASWERQAEFVAKRVKA